MNKVKFSAFGKVSIGKKNKTNTKLRSLQQKKLECNSEAECISLNKEIHDALNDANLQTLESNIAKLKRIQSTKGKTAAVFKLREDINGSSKSSNEPVVINDPETGVPVMTPTEIKKVSLNYCVKLLTNREPKEKYLKYFQETQSLHKARMNEHFENDVFELTQEMFQVSIKSITSKPGKKYNFIIREGQSLHEALFDLLSSVWKFEIIPKDWHKSTLI